MAPRHARVVALGGDGGAASAAAKNVVMRFEAEIKTRDKARVKSYARCEADAERIGAHNTSTCMYVSTLRRSHCNFESLHQGFVTCFMAKPFVCG